MGDNIDQIYRAYNGELGEKREMDVKNRLNWIVDEVVGKEILDIGCSQGICDILLAKRGKNILALDIEQESIDYAEKAILNEDDSIQQSINFVCADFLSYSFDNKKYDTILITEVLEHLENPTDFLKKAKNLLKDEGKLIITVPFGINDAPDHKRTYYFGAIYNQLENLFNIEIFEILGNWIGVVCSSIVQRKEKFEIDIKVLNKIENGFFKIERNLKDFDKARLTRIDRLLKDIEIYKNKVDLCEEKINHYKNEIEIQNEKYNNLAEIHSKESLKNKDEKLKYEKELLRFKNKYNDLANSKLGKLQLKYWSFKNGNKLPKVIQENKEIKQPNNSSNSKVKIIKNTNALYRIPTSKNAVLFMCTNGAGLGHLTRSLAIARRIKEMKPTQEIIFLTTSIAVNVVQSQGFPAYHIPPKALLGDDIDAKQWGELLKISLEQIFALYDLSTVVFDGAFPYAQFVKSINSQNGLEKIWVKRGGEKEGTSDARKEREKDFNHIILPGEIGGELLEKSESHITVEPIVFINDEELLTKEQVRRLFKVPNDKKLVYVQLGAGNINDIDSQLSKVINILRRRNDIMIVIGESIISTQSLNIYEKDIYVIKDYPNSKYFNGFDFVVSACGYNSFNELMYLGVPTLFLPNMQTKTDDQYGRAMLAVNAGVAFVMEEAVEEELQKLFEILADEEKNKQMRECAKKLKIVNGAEKAAKFIIEKTI